LGKGDELFIEQVYALSIICENISAIDRIKASYYFLLCILAEDNYCKFKSGQHENSIYSFTHLYAAANLQSKKSNG